MSIAAGDKAFRRAEKSNGSVSQKVLTAQLRDMEETDLLIERYAEVPPRVEHFPTELGQSLKPILDAMWSWGAKIIKKNVINNEKDRQTQTRLDGLIFFYCI